MLPFHKVILFHNHCPIHSTTMFTAYPQHIHTILFTITLPSILTVLFTFTFPFTMWIFFHSYWTIDSTTMSTAYPQHIHTVLFTITLPSTLALLYIYAFLFTMWYFSKITVQFTLQQCLQHILNIYMRYCLQLHYPVCWLFCLHMLSFSQCEYFSTHYCTIVYMTMFTFNLLCLHAVLFTITLDSILSVLFTYAVLFTMWYFSTITAQLTLQQCLQHILNIYIRYCLQLHYPVYWLCCLYMLPLHNLTFFHNHCTIDSTTMSTAYPQHIHIVLFATTPHSILALLFIYAFLFTMWYFSTMTAQFTLQQCLQHILNIYIQYCSQLHYPVYWL